MTSRVEQRTEPGHVLVIVQNLSVPFDRRVWMECRTLAAAGVTVSVICPRSPGDAAFEVLEGVRIHRYRPAPEARGVPGFARECITAWLRTFALSLRIFSRHRFDVIQACNPPDTYVALAMLYRPFGVRFVFDHHDLCPEIFVSRFGSRLAWARACFVALERWTHHRADRVIATNESYRRIAIERGGVDPEHVTVVRSGPDPALMRRGEPAPELRRGRPHLCCYLGVMGHQDRVDLLVRAIDTYVHDLGRDDSHFALLGFGDCYEELRDLTTALGLDDVVTFTGRADGPMIERYLSTASLGLSPDPKTPFNDLSTMNKVVEYLAFALPVVAFDLHETAVTAGPAAVLVPDDDPAGFATAIAALIDDPDRRAEMGALGRSRVESELGWPHQAERYLDVYRDLGVLGAPVPRPELALDVQVAA